MKTKDVTNMGINRNFLRKCKDEGLITPKEIDNEWIINKNYIPNEYSQEDVENVWHAYLCRKMGLSYSQIKDLKNGCEINIRDSFSELIQRCENQIAELQSLIEFMKYVKGLGFIPSPPRKLMGSGNFKNYITDYIEYLDEDKKIKQILRVAEFLSEAGDVELLKEEDFDKMELLYEGLELEIDESLYETYSLALLSLRNKTHLSASCEEVQNIIHQIFDYQKEITKNDTLSAWDFASEFIGLLSYESDISVMYKNLLGEKGFDLFMGALVEFLIEQEPNKIKQIRDKYKNLKDE